MEDIANAVSQIVRWIINLAPFGIMGLVYTNVATNGLAIFKDYGRLLLLLVGCMLATALIVDPLIAAANTVGIHVELSTAIVLAFIATLGACGTSGVAGGSLLLIPMACSLFGVDADDAMQVVAVGFVINVVQDSVETALNSSGDVMFAATAEYAQWQKQGKPLPRFLGGTLETRA